MIEYSKLSEMETRDHHKGMNVIIGLAIQSLSLTLTTTSSYGRCFGSDRRWHRRNGVVCLCTRNQSQRRSLIELPSSTITFDTLVRAGVECTSAFVAPRGESTASLVATCSRGVKLLPDAVLDPVIHGPVSSQYSCLTSQRAFHSAQIRSLDYPRWSKRSRDTVGDRCCTMSDSGLPRGWKIRWDDLRWLAVTTASPVHGSEELDYQVPSLRLPLAYQSNQ